LARSACARSSGERLWCGSCHHPHATPANRQQYYRDRCLACHGTALVERHPAPRDDCIGCHMSRVASSDIAHTSVTNHQILRRPAALPEPAAPRKLAAWREPAATVAGRNLGLAYISVGQRDQSAPQLNEGYRLLTEAQKLMPGDPDILTGLGLTLLAKGKAGDAARLFEQALRHDPRSAQHHLNLAVAQDSAGERQSAIQNLQSAIDLDPSI